MMRHEHGQPPRTTRPKVWTRLQSGSLCLLIGILGLSAAGATYAFAGGGGYWKLTGGAKTKFLEKYNKDRIHGKDSYWEEELTEETAHQVLYTYRETHDTGVLTERLTWDSPPEAIVPGETFSFTVRYKVSTTKKDLTGTNLQCDFGDPTTAWGTGGEVGQAFIHLIGPVTWDGGHWPPEGTWWINPKFVVPANFAGRKQMEFSVNVGSGAHMLVAWEYTWTTGTAPKPIVRPTSTPTPQGHGGHHADAVSPIAGTWAINSGGVVGTPDEKHISYRGTLTISASGQGLTATLQFAGSGAETLRDVHFSENVLTFVRTTSSATQSYKATLRGQELVGTFVHKDPSRTLTQYWEARKK